LPESEFFLSFNPYEIIFTLSLPKGNPDSVSPVQPVIFANIPSPGNVTRK